MTLRIGSNISSLQVQRQLARTSNELGATFERLSSGLRINRASDDAAGLSIASGLDVNRRVFNQGVRNLNDGLSLLNIAEGSVGQLSNIVIRQRELAEQAANGTLTTTQRRALDDEAQALSEEYERILNTTEFNGVNLLNGAYGSFGLQAGFGTDGQLDATVRQGETVQGTETVGLGTYTSNLRNFGKGGATYFGAEFLVGDLNNDGIDDIVAVKGVDNPGARNFTTYVGIFLGEDGGTTFTADFNTSIDTSYNPNNLLSANISANLQDDDADGDLDISLAIALSTDGVGVFNIGEFENQTVQNGGTFGMSNFALSGIFSGGDGLRNSVNGDFNNDGVTDVVENAVAGTVNILIQDTEAVATEVFNGESLEQSSFSLISSAFALQALDSLENNLNLINEIVSRIGASQNRVRTASSVLQVASEKTAAAQSRIQDIDVASESAKLTRLSLLQQASSSILAQANQQPALALSLLGNI